MRFLKRFSLLTIFVVLIPVAAQAQDVPDERFSLLTLEGREGKTGVQFFKGTVNLTKPSLLFAYKNRDFSDVTKICSSLQEAGCKDSPFLAFDAHLAPCSNEVVTDCIESVFGRNLGNGQKVLGEFQYSIPKSHPNDFPASVDFGLPKGSTSGIWKIPGAVHKGGTDEYAVVAFQSGVLVKEMGVLKRSKVAEGSFGQPEIQVAIFPIIRINGKNYYKSKVEIKTEESDKGTISHSFVGDSVADGCALVDDGICASRTGFPSETEFGLRIRLSHSLNGWVHGRIDKPQVEYNKSQGSTVMAISGVPMNVPVVSGWVDPTLFTAKDKEIIGSTSIRAGSWSPARLTGENAMQSLNIWNRLLGDKAAAYPAEWSFYSLTSSELQGSNSCIAQSKNLAGFVSTNSTTYTGGPPKFSSITQSLDYKIASPHFLKDGSVFEGRYNLSINSKVARCIYKFSNAPISASVSVVGGSGESRVATTAVSERKGWINLSVNGFTFSSPTVKVKLKQKK